jgi:hypothetical protein
VQPDGYLRRRCCRKVRLNGLRIVGRTHLPGSQDPTEDLTIQGLLIRKESLDAILVGTKTWEIRGAATRRRGAIALIESGSGNVVGTCVLSDVLGPLRVADLALDPQAVLRGSTALRFATAYAWVLGDARRLTAPIPYRHPEGAVVWVDLELSVCEQLQQRS